MTDQKKNSSGTGDGGQAEIQARFDEEQEKGYRGTRGDPTPLENYTLQGVTSGAPTPETATPGTGESARKDPEAVYGGLTGNDVIRSDKPGENPDGSPKEK